MLGHRRPDPCAEIDTTQRLNATTTVTSRAFYDGLGHLVETRSPAPGGQDVVQYRDYDPAQRLVFESVPYFVAAYSGGPGPAAYSIPDSTQAGTSYADDALGRVTATTDALSHQTTTAYTVVCGPTGSDSACYEQTATVDPNGHKSAQLTDALGRIAYVQTYSGDSGASYQLSSTVAYTYDPAARLVQILHPDGQTRTSFQYDLAGRLTGISDPDLGHESYTYDPDGNLVQSVDARGSAGTVYRGYDGLDRPVWMNTTDSPSGAFVTYGYDSTANGNQGVGRLTGESFSGAPLNALSGSESYTYDARGRLVGSTLTVGGSSYPLQTSYDDAGDVLSQQYPDGELVTDSYTAQGWLSGVSTQQGGTTTTLLANAVYQGVGGAWGAMTGASLGNGVYQYGASYDLLGRATDLRLTRSSDNAVLFEEQRSFDPAGNVVREDTTLPQGTDHQVFCYDEQDRLTWAGGDGALHRAAGAGGDAEPGRVPAVVQLRRHGAAEQRSRGELHVRGPGPCARGHGDREHVVGRLRCGRGDDLPGGEPGEQLQRAGDGGGAGVEPGRGAGGVAGRAPEPDGEPGLPLRRGGEPGGQRDHPGWEHHHHGLRGGGGGGGQQRGSEHHHDLLLRGGEADRDGGERGGELPGHGRAGDAGGGPGRQRQPHRQRAGWALRDAPLPAGDDAHGLRVHGAATGLPERAGAGRGQVVRPGGGAVREPGWGAAGGRVRPAGAVPVRVRGGEPHRPDGSHRALEPGRDLVGGDPHRVAGGGCGRW